MVASLPDDPPVIFTYLCSYSCAVPSCRTRGGLGTTAYGRSNGISLLRLGYINDCGFRASVLHDFFFLFFFFPSSSSPSSSSPPPPSSSPHIFLSLSLILFLSPGIRQLPLTLILPMGRHTWQETEVSGQHVVRNSSLPITM